MLSINPINQNNRAFSKTPTFSGVRQMSDISKLTDSLQKEAENLNNLASKIELNFEQRCRNQSEPEINKAGQDYINNLIRNIKKEANALITQAMALQNK